LTGEQHKQTAPKKSYVSLFSPFVLDDFYFYEQSMFMFSDGEGDDLAADDGDGR